MHETFHRSIQDAASCFKEIPKDIPIKIISLNSADGISASAILVKAFLKERRQYTLSVVNSLTEEMLARQLDSGFGAFVFCDLGSAYLKQISSNLPGKKIFIFDHQQVNDFFVVDNFVHINPHLHDFDGSIDISSAGIAFLFANAMNKNNVSMAYLALVGAIGDAQENGGFSSINKEILDMAIDERSMQVSEGLRLFGINTKPLYEVLENSSAPLIPGVSGSEKGALMLLKETRINPKIGNSWKKMIHLADDELKRLVDAILRRIPGEHDENLIFGNIYTLLGETQQSPYRDLREFATILDSCCKMSQPSIGVGACLGNKKMKASAIHLQMDYKKILGKNLSWFDGNTHLRGENYLIINAEENIRPTLISSFCSILAKTRDYLKGTIIIAMARTDELTTKVSARLCGSCGIDVSELLDAIIRPLDGECSGHKQVAGGMIKTEHEVAFIENAKKILERQSLEEVLC